MKGAHDKRFSVGILEIIKTSDGIIIETRGCSVNEVGVLGVIKCLLEGAFRCAR